MALVYCFASPGGADPCVRMLPVTRAPSPVNSRLLSIFAFLGPPLVPVRRGSDPLTSSRHPSRKKEELIERLQAADAADAAANGPAAAPPEPAKQPAKVPPPSQADAVPKRAAGRARKPAVPAKLVCSQNCTSL